MSVRPHWRVLQESLAVVIVGGLAATVVWTVRGQLPALAIEATLCTDAAMPSAAAGAVTPHWIGPAGARAKRLAGATLFVDVRPSRRYAEGHIAQAAHWGVGTQQRILAMSDQPALSWVVYDDTHDDCSQARAVAQRLLQHGAQRVFLLEGGFPAWFEAGYEAEAGECEDCLSSGAATMPSGMPQ